MPLSHGCGIREQLFLQQVLRDVHTWQEQEVRGALIFPPLIAPRFRFLLHDSIARHFPDTCCSISIGSKEQRRTIVYDMSLVPAAGAAESHQHDHAQSDVAAARVKRPNKKLAARKLYQPPQATSSSSTSSPSSTNETAAAAAEDETWDSLYDDSGDCIDPQLIGKFKSALSLSDDESIRLDKVAGDYSDFTADEAHFDLTDHEYGHVLEVYAFAEDFKTPDLFSRLAAAGTTDFDIVWVDETHALAVFGSQVAANSALHFTFADVKVRVLSQGTRESKAKAKKCTDRLLPFKKRPQTSLDAARRLVGRHLGLKVEVSKEQLQAEKKALQEAKDRRRQIRKQTNDVWEGNVN